MLGLVLGHAEDAPSPSPWCRVALEPPNAIFHLNTRFAADREPYRLDLGVGAYRTAEGTPYVFDVVKRAEADVISDPKHDHEYLPIAGHKEFRALSARLVFGGDDAVLSRVASIQTVSGTNALRVAAEFIHFVYPHVAVYVSKPTWANHMPILTDAGLAGAAKGYRYFRERTRMLDFEGMMEDLSAAPRGSVVLLHACAHNPTGVDLSPDEWRAAARLFVDHDLIALFDTAYQGFATGDPEEDIQGLRTFVAEGVPVIAAQSYSKNLGLYCERVGCLHVATASAAEAKAVLSRLELIVRPMYSNPPGHGAKVVARILSDPDLAAAWKAELLAAMDRIHAVRRQLLDCLTENGTPGSWDHVVKQIGMFSFTGLTVEQSTEMVEEHHIYMLKDGRVNVAGLASHSVQRFAACVHHAVTGSWPASGDGRWNTTSRL